MKVDMTAPKGACQALDLSQRRAHLCLFLRLQLPEKKGNENDPIQIAWLLETINLEIKEKKNDFTLRKKR